MVVTSAGAVPIDTGDQHRWMGNGYFESQNIEEIAHAGEHLNGLKVLKERLDGTVPTLPTRFVKDIWTRAWNWVVW